MSERAWPWGETDVVLACLLQVAGLIAIIAAWFGASQPGTLMQQSAWVHVAAAGLVVSGAGAGQWLMRGRRAVGQRREALVSLDPVDESPAAPSDAGIEPLTLVRAHGMHKVHDPSCPLVADKDVEPATVDDGEPCAVCRP